MGKALILIIVFLCFLATVTTLGEIMVGRHQALF